ncbi:hypothetical protein ACWE42_11010 [Sutcliffiella cohnii]
MFNNLNPIFNEEGKDTNFSEQLVIQTQSNLPKKERVTRSDRTHSVKFPVSLDQQILFKSSLRRFKFHYSHIEIKQTKYNTLLLAYALHHPQIIDWTMKYIGTSEFHMTTKLQQRKYTEIDGIHGIALTRGFSTRKTVGLMTLSALTFIEKEDRYYEILQQIRDSKK